MTNTNGTAQQQQQQQPRKFGGRVFAPGDRNSEGGGGGKFDLIEADIHDAVCVAIIDLGHRHNDFASDEEKAKPAPRSILFVWELPAIKRFIALDVNEYYSEKAKLRKMLEAWRGAPYKPGDEIDPTAVLARKCRLNVIHKASKSNPDRHYAKVDDVIKPGASAKNLKASVTPFVWLIGDGPEPEFEWLPWLYGKTVAQHIRLADEYTKRTAVRAVATTNGKPAADVLIIEGDGEPEDSEQAEYERRTAGGVQASEDIPF